MLDAPHMAPLMSFVRELRAEMGRDYAIPFFDPHDGGTSAEILFLLEAPGRQAVRSGFISRNNPDETAKNFFSLNQEARLDRRLTVTWNIVPWYIGDGQKIRAARRDDISLGLCSLDRLLGLLPRLAVAVFLGKKAAYAAAHVVARMPGVRILRMPHPSPLFVNRAPGNHERLLAVLQQVAATVRQ